MPLRRYVSSDEDSARWEPSEALASLPGVLWHLSDAWSRRERHNVAFVHFDDLRADLDGQMRRLAALLEIDVHSGVWGDLVQSATLEGMRARADRLAPNAAGILRDPEAFFRAGASGAGAELLSAAALRRYHERASDLAPSDLLAWLHR
ncbi:MAG: sulfotransferase domain-containing protein [Egibacteraceae bacterium]